MNRPEIKLKSILTSHPVMYYRKLDFSDCLLRKKGSDSEPPSRYDLIAVSNHYGGLRDGHCMHLILKLYHDFIYVHE